MESQPKNPEFRNNPENFHVVLIIHMQNHASNDHDDLYREA